MTDHVQLDSLFAKVNNLERIQEKYWDSVEYLHKNFDLSTRMLKFGNKRETKTGIETINTHDKMIFLGKPGAGKPLI